MTSLRQVGKPSAACASCFELTLTLLLALGVTPVRAGNPDALWHIVHDRCVPDQQAHDLPAPCALVDLAHGYVVLKDRTGATQFLLMPTAKVTGIEDAAILAPGAPNYFAAAWQSRDMVSQRAQQKLPRDDIGLVINSTHGRTQNQLHIHIDCLRPEVVAAVRAHAAAVGTAWAPFPVKLVGHPYLARRVASADLSGANPFTLLADGVPGARADMGDWTLAAAPATVAGAPGFVLLADQVDGATARPCQRRRSCRTTPAPSRVPAERRPRGAVRTDRGAPTRRRPRRRRADPAAGHAAPIRLCVRSAERGSPPSAHRRCGALTAVTNGVNNAFGERHRDPLPARAREAT